MKRLVRIGLCTLLLTGLPVVAQGASEPAVDPAARPTAKHRTVLISLSSTGTAGNYDSGAAFESVAVRNEVSISGSGRFVAFQSDAANLVGGADRNDRGDVFVRDRDVDRDGVLDEPGAVRTTIVSVSDEGTQDRQPCFGPSISRDGRFVAFSCFGALVPEDTNGAGDVYVRDRDTDRDGVMDEPGAVSTDRVSVGPNGEQGQNGGLHPVITPDGRFVVFSSISTTLLPTQDADNLEDIYVRDRDTDRDGVMDEPSAVDTVLISQPESGPKEWTTNQFPTITPDGRFVVWESLGQDWVPGDANRASDLYVRDRDVDRDGVMDEAGQTRTSRLTVGARGADADQESQEASISDNGRWVTFSSQASNLVPRDTNDVRDVFVVDRDPDADGRYDEGTTNRVRRMSVSSRGRQADSRSSAPMISPDGRVIVFESQASNLHLSSGFPDIFVRDRDADGDRRYDEARASTTALLILSRRGGPAVGSSFGPAVSANRRWFAFSSYAENLVGRSGNNRTDVFVRGPFG